MAKELEIFFHKKHKQTIQREVLHKPTNYRGKVPIQRGICTMKWKIKVI